MMLATYKSSSIIWDNFYFSYKQQFLKMLVIRKHVKTHHNKILADQNNDNENNNKEKLHGHPLRYWQLHFSPLGF